MSVRGKRFKPNVEGTQVTSVAENVSGHEEWYQRGDHPLLNDLILETLFGYVRRFDLKDCRGVCKKWNIRTIPHMRSTFKVTIQSSESTSEPNRRISEFVRLFSSNELGIPFAKFQLGRFSTTYRSGHHFLHLCGESVTEIDFMYRRSKTYKIENVSDILRFSTNLKVLGLPEHLISRSGDSVKLFHDSIPTLFSLEKITFQPDDMRVQCPTFIEELLTAAPNLSEIVMHDNVKYDEEEDKNLSASNINVLLNCVEKLGMESSIQSLSLYEVRGQHIEQLQRMAKKEKGLKLKSLTLNVSTYGYIYERLLTAAFDSAQIQLVKVLRNTLQHLNLNVGRSVETSLMKFPIIPNLRSLTLREFPRSHPEAVNLNKKFPALETLDLDVARDWGNWDNGFSLFESCDTLKALRLRDHANLAIGIQTFHNILRVFPNLIKLDLKVDEDGAEILRQIWSQMTGLESLVIDGCIGVTELELDSLFTGIPTQTLKEIRHVMKELDKMTVHERRQKIQELQDDNRCLPSIQNLTNLTHLNVGVTGGVNWNSECHPTDLTAYLAFHSMKRLRHLEVEKCMFSRTCCETLKEDMGLETWSFRNENGRSIIRPFLLREGQDEVDLVVDYN